MGRNIIYAVIINIVFFSVFALTKLYLKRKNESVYRRVVINEYFAYTPLLDAVPAISDADDTARFFDFFNDSGFVLNVLQPDLHMLPLDRPVYLSRSIGGGFYEVYNFDTCCWGAQRGITHINYLHKESIPQPLWDSIKIEIVEIDSTLDAKYGPMRTNRPSQYGIACW